MSAMTDRQAGRQAGKQTDRQTINKSYSTNIALLGTCLMYKLGNKSTERSVQGT